VIRWTISGKRLPIDKIYRWNEIVTWKTCLILQKFWFNLRQGNRQFGKSLLAVLACLVSACSPYDPMAGQPTMPFKSPTSIYLALRTPRPTLTPTPVITPTITRTPDPDPGFYYGGIGLIVTLDYVGQTIKVKKQESFILQLGDAYTWGLKFDPAIISRNMKIMPEIGQQGVFIARERGHTILKAVGEPACLQEKPPCALPDVLFQVLFIVE
jgi:hypothetical protein